MSAPPRVLVLACGALAREFLDLVRRQRFDHVTVECLPARLHWTPAAIPELVRRRVLARRDEFDRVLVGYADCGTVGGLDEVCDELRSGGLDVERLPGAHCFETFAGGTRYADLQDADPATFYVTDFLARHFERFVMVGLGLDRHPELRDLYFGNYRRLVYLPQTDAPDLVVAARAAADRLGLAFGIESPTYGDVEVALGSIVGRAA